MDSNKIFTTVTDDLPQPLPNEELYHLLKLIREGSKEAYDKLVEHNIRLVIYEVNSRFKNVNYSKEDLVAIGTEGLINAINTYDLSNNSKFSYYATKCIDNIILKFLRQIKKEKNVDSLDRIIFENSDGREIRLSETISDDVSIVENYENKELHKIVREVVMDLPERDREIIMRYFGFYNDKVYTQQEIANKFNITQQEVSRLISKNVKYIGTILESKDVIGLQSKQIGSRKQAKRMTKVVSKSHKEK